MSATDMLWLFSEAVIPAKQAYMEREPLSDGDNGVSCATVTLHTKSMSQTSQGFTAVICFKCYQTYVDVAPARCGCGEMLAQHGEDMASALPIDTWQSATAISRRQTLPIAALPPREADPWETRAVANIGFAWPPWAIPPSIVSGDTMTTSPYGGSSNYVAQIRVAKPPPPPPAMLHQMKADTHIKDTCQTIMLCIVLLGILYILRAILAL